MPAAGFGAGRVPREAIRIMRDPHDEIWALLAGVRVILLPGVLGAMLLKLSGVDTALIGAYLGALLVVALMVFRARLRALPRSGSGRRDERRGR
jgi:cobalamin synthase